MRPKRRHLATAEETASPPSTLPQAQIIAKIIKAAGNNLYSVQQPTGEIILVEMPARFRSAIWVKRGTFVLVDTSALATRENKLGGEIVNVVTNEKAWRKQTYWPAQFPKAGQSFGSDNEDDEEMDGEGTVMDKMPPSDSDSN